MRSRMQKVLLVFACLSASALSTFAADGVSGWGLLHEIDHVVRDSEDA